MSEMNQHGTNTEMLEMNHQQEEEDSLVLGGNQDFDRANINSPEQKPKGKYNISWRMAVMLLAVMFSVILVFQVVLVVMATMKDTKCVCQVAGHNDDTSSLYYSITPVSCKDIKEKLPNSPSGYYHVNNRDIYCNMDELCGSGGGWTRLAYLDMTDSTVDCPDELQYTDPPPDGVRMCQRPNSQSAGCSSPVKFPSNGISYSEICGRVIGYQYGSPDAVDTSNGPISAHNDLNSYYVDGISLTRGSPRQHVWTFMAGPYENLNDIHNCPCNAQPGGSQVVQPFVGSHYFCESGNPATIWNQNVYTSDPLWDGKGCGSQEGECCNAPGLPWFHRQYNTTKTDSLDMRICGDEQTSDENTPVSFYEIFVK